MSDQIRQFLEEAGCRLVKPSGDNLIATCPFHDDTRRSFSMNSKTGQWTCFSESCGRSGGLKWFLVDGCGYSRDVAAKLAEEWSEWEGKGGEDGWPRWPGWEERDEEGVEHETVMERLLGLYDFCPRYMRERGFSRSTLWRWEVGYDSEADRVTLPVRDETGRLVGFSKRSTTGAEPKYLHLGFKRSKVLYGEFFCPSDAGVQVWVCEGQMDALALWQMGVKYPVATMSARVGPLQVARISRYPRVVLAFDNDADGRSAARRVGDKLIEAGHREVFVAREFGGLKDPGEVMEVGRGVREFIDGLEPYELVRLGW